MNTCDMSSEIQRLRSVEDDHLKGFVLIDLDVSK